ncbi:PE-PPE domain-containing protein [Mycobacterium sp. ITM-2017-0098]|nr:PE-PPE domain-containing protein [Mycobacterium sp. ITM-2017-0098]
MGKRQLSTGGKHQATKKRRTVSERPRSAQRRAIRVKAAVSAVGVAAAAMAGAAVIGVAPTLSASPQLASLHYLRGTNIGGVPTEQQYLDFITVVVDGSDTTPPEEPYEKVPYNAGFWPFSHGGFGDLTYNDSVAQGIELLAAQQPAAGDVIFGYSQGAVAASLYKATHTGNTYILVENPSRPNGGVMQRFKGLTIPLLDVTFTGATPNNGVDGGPGDLTIDVARQYDGWADFPRYLWNPVAIANAVMGILLLHGPVQTELTAADLDAARESGDPDYYQFDVGSNTHYYVVKTYPIPLLMPLDPFLSDSALAALDAPLRAFIETAYDRTDYSTPARATLFKPLDLADADDADVQTARIADEPEIDTDAVEPVEPAEGDLQGAAEERTGKSRGHDADAEVLDPDVGDDDLASSESADPGESASEDDDVTAAPVSADSDGADADADADTDSDSDSEG